MHSWGDDWPYWVELYQAAGYFSKFFRRCTGQEPMIKEKYGTIRYEMTFIWLDSKEHSRIFREAIMRTVRKFPKVAGEIADDAGHVLNDEYFEGWCRGVTFKANGSYWKSTKRPNGV